MKLVHLTHFQRMEVNLNKSRIRLDLFSSKSLLGLEKYIEIMQNLREIEY